jgi:hypothetical protein
VETNPLYCGDNPTILRDFFLDKSVDLIYVDSPFNSNRNYSLIFKDQSGTQSNARCSRSKTDGAVRLMLRCSACIDAERNRER